MGDRHTDTARRHVPSRKGEELLFNRALGANLRAMRSHAKLTQDQLAVQAGMTRGSIANIERGEQVPGLYRLLLICAGLNCDLTDVLPSESFTPESIADSIGDHYSTAVQQVKKQALRQRVKAETAR